MAESGLTQLLPEAGSPERPALQQALPDTELCLQHLHIFMSPTASHLAVILLGQLVPELTAGQTAR